MFSLFDKDEDSVVKVTDIGPMLRSIGFNPSEVEIERLQEEQDTDNGTTAWIYKNITSAASLLVQRSDAYIERATAYSRAASLKAKFHYASS